MKQLPVDPERLKAEFPDLTEPELKAYESVTRYVLAHPQERAAKMKEVMASAREAQAKADAGETLTTEEMVLIRYLHAMAKMQRSTTRKPQ